jgi:hypothetical protein
MTWQDSTDIVLRLPDGEHVIVPQNLVERSKLLTGAVDSDLSAGSLPVQRDLAQHRMSMACIESVSSVADVHLAKALQVRNYLEMVRIVSAHTPHSQPPRL